MARARPLTKEQYRFIEGLIWENPYAMSEKEIIDDLNIFFTRIARDEGPVGRGLAQARRISGAMAQPKIRRKLNDWQKFVKANSKKPRFRYKSGSKKGKINLKALGVAYRKKKRR